MVSKAHALGNYGNMYQTLKGSLRQKTDRFRGTVQASSSYT